MLVAQPAWLSGLCMIYSLPSQLPASPPCLTASFIVIHFAAILFSVQPIMSAALLHLTKYFTCSLIGLFSGAAVFQPQFALLIAFRPSQPLLLDLSTLPPHSTAAVKSLLLDDRPPLLMLFSLICSVAQPVPLAVLSHLLTAHSHCLVFDACRLAGLSILLSVQPFLLDGMYHLLSADCSLFGLHFVCCLFTGLGYCFVCNEKVPTFIIFPQFSSYMASCFKIFSSVPFLVFVKFQDSPLCLNRFNGNNRNRNFFASKQKNSFASQRR
jgi:hypothetical protein